MSDVIQTGKCEPKETLHGFDVDSLSQEALRIWSDTFGETSSAERADEAVSQFKDRCKSGMFSLASASIGECPCPSIACPCRPMEDKKVEYGNVVSVEDHRALQDKYDALVAEHDRLLKYLHATDLTINRLFDALGKAQDNIERLLNKPRG